MSRQIAAVASAELPVQGTGFCNRHLVGEIRTAGFGTHSKILADFIKRLLTRSRREVLTKSLLFKLTPH